MSPARTHERIHECSMVILRLDVLARQLVFVSLLLLEALKLFDQLGVQVNQVLLWDFQVGCLAATKLLSHAYLEDPGGAVERLLPQHCARALAELGHEQPSIRCELLLHTVHYLLVTICQATYLCEEFVNNILTLVIHNLANVGREIRT